MSETPISYADSGVNIDEAARALRAVAPLISRTHDSRVLGGIGGFGGLFDGSFTEDRPVLVSSIDGVGTKTKVAAMVGDYSNLGRDLVNHCINDILCQGAKPLFFMDYFGCSHLQGSVFEAVVGGAAEACFESGCALVGGETAEMPGVYHDDEIDIVGAIVGIVSQGMQLPKPGIEPNDAIIGIASSGLHTNGFSLARKVLFDIGGLSVRDEVPGLGTALGLELLRAHRCYFNSVYPLLQEVPEIMAIAHITGGGLYDNLPRVLGQDVRATIDRRSWTPLPVFELIERVGNVAWPEMYRTFNMGIGMVLVVKRDVASAVVQRLSQAGEMASVIGEIERGPRDVQIV
ncbi:MAG: phosphoribosylformylglycinamidine cyclo-ligase [Armatimonadetes bacterium]|nr:phosphoribosylformylglycinamidine cyclo-ligase [Armatimonadota bacterium]